jgi:hypothetical protein
MSAQSRSTTPAPRWLIHDLIIGSLSGIGVGSLVGLFISARWVDNNLVVLAGALVGAVVGVVVLLRSHQRHDRFVTTSVVLAWLLLVASGALIAALTSAIAKFT